MLRITVPGLFMVPTITISPRSTLSWVTVPAMGAVKTVFLRLSCALRIAALERATSSRFTSARARSVFRCVREVSISWGETSFRSKSCSFRRRSDSACSSATSESRRLDFAASSAA